MNLKTNSHDDGYYVISTEPDLDDPMNDDGITSVEWYEYLELARSHSKVGDVIVEVIEVVQ